MHHLEKRELKKRLRIWYLSTGEIPNDIKLHSVEVSYRTWYWYLNTTDFYYTGIKEANRDTLGKAVNDLFDIIKVLIQMKEELNSPKKKRKKR